MKSKQYTLGIDISPSQWSKPFLDVVYNCGLNIKDVKNADILVKSAVEITEDDLSRGQKIIALEKTAGGLIAYRDILKHPAVIRYVKSFNYKSLDLHNLPTVDGRYFTRLLSHGFDLQLPEETISESDYAKIRLGWSTLHFDRLGEIAKLDTSELIEKDEHRPIDVFFAGTVEYYNKSGNQNAAEIISGHRKTCADILDAVKNCETLVVRGRKLDQNDYNQIICHSKIVVSPWGWGEPCYRDYEALLAGCILIKPATDFIRSACGIFERPHCIWTAPDFSHLFIDIEKALRNFKISKQKRMESRMAMINCINNLPMLIKTNLTI